MVYTDFNKKIFKGLDAKFIGNMIIIELNKKVIAKIELIYHGVVGNYDTYEVSIINKEIGLIDKNLFKFYDYFTEKDKKANCPGDKFYINASTEDTDWHLAVPKPSAIKRYTNLIMEYIYSFK